MPSIITVALSGSSSRCSKVLRSRPPYFTSDDRTADNRLRCTTDSNSNARVYALWSSNVLYQSHSPLSNPSVFPSVLRCCPDNIMLLPRLLRPNCAASITRPLASNLSLHSRAFSTPRRLHQQIAVDDDPFSKLPGIDPSALNVTETMTPKQLVPNQDLVFGRTFTGNTISTSKHQLLDQLLQTTCSPSNGPPLKAG